MPVVLVRCVIAITLVRGRDRLLEAPSTTPPQLRAGIGTGSSFTTKPSRLRAHLPRIDVGRMIVVGDDHFVARP